MNKCNRLIILLALLWLSALGCASKHESQWLIVSEAVHFGVQPGSGSLNLPVFAGTLDVDNIVHDVSQAEYYHRKFAAVYGEKAFYFIADSTIELMFDMTGPLARPQSVYGYDSESARIELDLVSFDGAMAHYAFRVGDKATGQIRNHHVAIPIGQSASIGMLFDRERNRGYLVAVSVQALEISDTLTPAAFADFLRHKNTPRGVKSPSKLRPADQKWMDELFGTRAIRLTDSLKHDAIADPQPFDLPPAPIGGIAAIGCRIIYPESAKRDSVQGRVLVSVDVDSTGEIKSCQIVRGIREDLDSAAVVAIREIRFSPATFQGKPVSTTIMIPIEFKLDS